MIRLSVFSLRLERSSFHDLGIACNNCINKNLLFSGNLYTCFSSSHVFNFCLSLNKCPTQCKTFVENYAKYILLLSILIFLLYHRAYDAIAEDRAGVEVMCKHYFLKMVL